MSFMNKMIGQIFHFCTKNPACNDTICLDLCDIKAMKPSQTPPTIFKSKHIRVTVISAKPFNPSIPSLKISSKILISQILTFFQLHC